MGNLNQKLYAFALARYFDWLRVVKGRKLAIFFRDGGIGDILCTFPAAVALADREPDAYKIYCTNPGFVDLPAMTGRFDRVMGIRCNDLVAASTSRMHAVRRFRYPDEIPGQASSAYLPDEFSASFQLPAGLPRPPLDLGEPSEKVKALLAGGVSPAGPIVCIHTGPTWVVREWPRESWNALVRKMKAEWGCRVLEIGASRHFREGERKDPCVEGAEECRDIFSLRETFQIVAQARLVVGIDSGMVHVAAALARPAVGVFGPTSAYLRLPETGAAGVTADVPCLGCHHRHPRLHWQSGCTHEVRCMRELESDAVFAEAARFW